MGEQQAQLATSPGCMGEQQSEGLRPTPKAAYICGTIRTDLKLKGIPLALADLQIASIAFANDLILVTGNIKHFQCIPDLKIENWL